MLRDLTNLLLLDLLLIIFYNCLVLEVYHNYVTVILDVITTGFHPSVTKF